MDRYITSRSELISTGAPGLHSARRLAALTDELLRRLAAASSATPPGRWSLIALGGYGAGALLPSSDIDVLLVSDAPASVLRPFVESLLYPLWDAGLAVGHQVRSPKAHLSATREDETICMATLTGRVVCGDADYGTSLLDRCCADGHKRSRGVLSSLARRDRPGSPYLLEPDLKSGAGGRRDYDELVWTAAVLTGVPQTTPWALLEADVLADWELGLLEAASALVVAARWELGARGDGSRMTLDAADALSIDVQAVQVALADTAHVLERARRRVVGKPAGLASRVPDPRVANPLTADEVFGLLRQGDAGVGPLEEAAWLGRLDALVPAFKSLLSLRRPALTHTLAVGAHSIRCAALAATLPATEPSALARSRAAISDDRPLLVAALTHDRAKSRPGPKHAERGALTASESAWLFGLDAGAQADVADLVRLHLALAESAMHDDLDSEDVILGVAERVGRRELVAPLHVLTVADSLSTGPTAWGPWQETLVGALVSRVDAALSPDIDGAGLAKRGEEVRAATLSALPADTDAAVADFVRNAPLRYLSSREPAQVSMHARLVADLDVHSAPTRARLAVRPGPLPETFEVAVVAKDRPELFARVAGALTLAGLDILAVDAYSTANGIALDIFTVRSATLAPVEHETWQRAERYLDAALADRLELETRLAERGRHYSGDGTRRARVGTRVRVDTSAGYDTAVLVTAADRVGLLYDIARAIASVGLDIRWAKALTNGGIARDTFHVVGPDGQAPTDSGVLGHLAMRIRELV